MRTFHTNQLGAAIILAILGMGVIGLAVVLPVAFIQWTWNSLIPPVSSLPPISAWQAILLYLAGAILVYLSGIVHIEFETEN